MISIITGKILSNSGGEIIVLTAGGVGYKVATNPLRAEKWPVGSEAEILTYLAVREDALELYGFESSSERKLFLQFLTVSGIGPKTALHLLSLGTVEEIAAAIARGDVSYLTKVSGVGRKTAERMVVELKDKVAGAELFGAKAAGGDALGDVMDGLMALGYSGSQARAAVKGLNPAGKTSEQLLKEALQIIK